METLLALLAFVGSHVLVARTGLKGAIEARIGRAGYLFAYSALSLALLGWIVVALLRAERKSLWATPEWAHAFALVATALAFALLGAGAVTPNPLSAAFVRAPYDPARPGLVGWTRHPIIWGFGLWGAAHAPANGEWPALALFAGSALFAVVGAAAVTRRLRRSMDAESWRRLQPGPGHPTARAALGAAAGLGAWAAFLWLHPHLFGVDPLAAALAR
jgi:uncharacterized membrane protein